MRILRRDQHRLMPWRNGGGSTWEVLREPASVNLGNADLRLSFAEVEQAGPFSSFPGLERVLVLVHGGTLVLDIDGREVVLQPGAQVAFPGEARVSSRPAEASVDFNVMARRGACSAQVEVRSVDAAGCRVEAAPGTRMYLAVLDGGVRVDVPGQPYARLGPLDVVAELPDGTGIRATDALARVAVVRVRPAGG